MKLTVISAMDHYIGESGRVFGWGATVQELDELARLFDEVCHVAVVHDKPPPASALPYRSSNVTLKGLPPSGGTSWLAKLGVLVRAPHYVVVIWRTVRGSDAVHVRAPANVALFGLLVLALRRSPRPRWVKYAGNWSPQHRDALGYRVQRWLLRQDITRAKVTVNALSGGEVDHVVTFFNPTLTDVDLEAARAAVGARAFDLRGRPVRILFVGRVEEAKGAGRTIDVVAELRQRRVQVEARVIGDGPARQAFEAQARARHVADAVTFRGWVNKLELASEYEAADFLLLPTTASEGLPKVVCEAIAYGCIPITSSVSSLPEALAHVGAGRALEDISPSALASAVESYLDDPGLIATEARRGSERVDAFTYEYYLDRVIELFASQGVELERLVPTHYARR